MMQTIITIMVVGPAKPYPEPKGLAEVAIKAYQLSVLSDPQGYMAAKERLKNTRLGRSRGWHKLSRLSVDKSAVLPNLITVRARTVEEFAELNAMVIEACGGVSSVAA